MNRSDRGVWVKYSNDDTLGMVLVVCAWLGALYFYIAPHSPGWAIGAFGFATFIAGYRPQASRVERVGWLFALLLFMFLEFQAINRNDKENRTTRDDEKAEFQGIIDGLKRQLTVSQTQYEHTIAQVNTTLTTTQTALKNTQAAANLARAGVRGLTGGDSYLLVGIMPPFPPNIPHSPGDLDFAVLAMGKYTLWDVRVEWQATENPTADFFAGKQRQAFTFNAVSTTYSFPLGPRVHPDPAKEENDYWFWVFARNDPTREIIRIRFNKTLRRWEWKWTVWRSLTRPKATEKLLVDRPWTAMSPLLPVPPA